MPTNPIGTGTRNMVLNVSTDERDFWGQLATERGASSIAELQRITMLLGLRLMSPAKAQQLIAIRQRYYGTAADARRAVYSTALLLLFVVSMLQFLFTKKEEDFARRPARVRTVRTVKGIRSRVHEEEMESFT